MDIHARLRAFGAAAIVACASTAYAQALDTVMLVNGGRVRGTVLVDEPAGVTIQLADGTTRKLVRAEVLRVEYAGGQMGGESAAPPAAPAAAPPAAPPSGQPPAYGAAPAGGQPPAYGAPPAYGQPPTYGAPPLGAGGSDTPTPTKTKGIAALYIAGPILLGVAWGATIGVTAAESRGDGEFVGYAAIPVAGPWVILGKDPGEGYVPALVVSGVLQSAGLVMTVLGLTIRRRVPATALDLGDGHTATLRPAVGPRFVGVAGAF